MWAFYALILCYLNTIFAGDHIFKEKIIRLNHNFKLLNKVSDKDLHNFHDIVIAVKQKNIELLEEHLSNRANPTHHDYRKWFNKDQVYDILDIQSSYNSVIKYLNNYDDISVVDSTIHGEYIIATGPLYLWESIFNCVFYNWLDTDVNEKYVRAKEYYLPVEINDDITGVFNIADAPPIITSTGYKVLSDKHGGISRPFKETTAVYANGLVDPQFLQYLYNIPTTEGSSSMSQSVFETKTQFWSADDLTQFQEKNNLVIQSAVEVSDERRETSDCDINSAINCDESNLDLQYIMAMSQNTITYFWFIPSSAKLNVFVEYLIAVANSTNPSLVNSVSWGSVEQSCTQTTLDLFNIEAIKLNSMGATIIVSSGDNGVANSGCNCNSSLPITSQNCACLKDSGSGICSYPTNNSWTGEGYFPSFPATSPYVVSVGATQGPEDSSTEIACQSDEGGLITSGGGFSTYYTQGSWQSNLITHYFDSLSATEVPANGFNEKGRGYPDVSLIGVYYQVVINSVTYSIFGTSASAPVFAGMVSLLNWFLVSNGQSTVGWMNPTLYSFPSKFNDISSGKNMCCALVSSKTTATCCDSGFYSTKNWDPVTGLGSIQFNQLASIYNVSYDDPNYALSAKGDSNRNLIPSLTAIIVMFSVIFSLCCFYYYNEYRKNRDYGISLMQVQQTSNNVNKNYVPPVSSVAPGAPVAVKKVSAQQGVVAETKGSMKYASDDIEDNPLHNTDDSRYTGNMQYRRQSNMNSNSTFSL